MKRTILLALSILAVTSVLSLSSNAQVGMQFGYNRSNLKAKVGSVSKYSDAMNGFNLGLTYDSDFNKYFGIQTGLLYSFYSETIEDFVWGMYSVTYKTMYHYATIPINLKGKLEFGNSGFSVFAFAGPDIILGVAAIKKEKFGKSYPVNMYKKDSAPKRFDLALTMGVGVVIDYIKLKFGYGFGLLNLYDSEDVKTSRNHFNISLGFLF